MLFNCCIHSSIPQLAVLFDALISLQSLLLWNGWQDFTAGFANSGTCSAIFIAVHIPAQSLLLQWQSQEMPNLYAQRW